MATTTTTRRTPQRAEFLTHIVITAVEGGLGPWTRVLQYRAVLPTPDNTEIADASLTVDATDDPITLDDIEQALHAISAGGVPNWDDRSDARMLVRDADATDDATDIDAELADAIIQVAVLGQPVYEFPGPTLDCSGTWLA